MPPDKTHTLSPMVYNHVYYIRVFAHFQQETEYFFLRATAKFLPVPAVEVICFTGIVGNGSCAARADRRIGSISVDSAAKNAVLIM